MLRKCALCGYEFDAESLVCHSSCPLAHHCAVICCPNCGYQVVDESKSALVTLAAKIKRKWAGQTAVSNQTS
ncbi:MAG: hypothetical protein H6658_17125 [Ardenticatenaceae bacterium]|nr:hypothetical protein [Ardenticatenaceae bacterium]